MPFRDAIGCFVFSVAPGGLIAINKYDSTTEGESFLDLCADDESRDRWREAYKTCFALHESQKNVSVNVRLKDGRVIGLVSDLIWDRGDHVLFYVQREWPADLLTAREQEFLQLVACGLSAKSMARVMETTPENARATISRVRKKLNVVHEEGLVVAALQFRTQGAKR